MLPWPITIIIIMPVISSRSTCGICCSVSLNCFTEAKKSAQIPFLYYHLLECDYHGKEYTIKDHDITITIPKEAIQEGKKVHLEIAVALYGPFKFIGNMQPTSPILWLCLEELRQCSEQATASNYPPALSQGADRIQREGSTPSSCFCQGRSDSGVAGGGVLRGLEHPPQLLPALLT